jgi:curli biogenesis system outer membrane secretion channel CsgG
MKRVIIALVLCFTFLTFSQVFAKEKPRLGVLRFTNNTSAAWWSGTAGRDLQDMLAAELVTLKAFQVLERKELEAVIGEQNLGASGRIKKKHQVENREYNRG